MRADCFFLMRQQVLRVTQMLSVPIILLALSSTASAQIEPALPGSVEYSLISNNQSWIGTSDPIDIGTYVEDLLTDRLNQPAGRGYIGIVTDTGFDQDYNEMAAMVDFGRNYSVGIVFSELTAVQIVPEPSTLLLMPGVLFWCASVRRRRPQQNTTTKKMQGWVSRGAGTHRILTPFRRWVVEDEQPILQLQL